MGTLRPHICRIAIRNYWDTKPVLQLNFAAHRLRDVRLPTKIICGLDFLYKRA